MKYLPFLILAIGNFCFGQKGQRIYKFDYMLEYEYQEHSEAPKVIRYILTNSQKSNYKLTVEVKDSLYNLQFIDQDGVYGWFLLSKADFYQARTFDLNCDIVTRYKNPYVYRRKDYEYIATEDTIIRSNVYDQYILKNNKKRKEKFDLPRIRYVMEKNTSYHEPVFTHPIAYEEWKKEKTLPNGIPKLMFCYKRDKEKFHYYKLKNIFKMEKFISFDKGCKRLRGTSLPPILEF